MPLTYAWSHLTDALVDGDSETLSSTFTTLAHDITNVNELIGDPATYTAEVAHSHDGINSARIWPHGPNLVISSKFNDETAGNGFDDFISYNVTLGEDKDDGGAHMQTSADVISTKVAGSCVAANFGTASLLIVSVMVNSTGVQSAGELRFGLANYSDSSNSTFRTGCRGSVTTSNIGGAGWRRYWFTCDAGTITTSLIFKAYVSTTWTNELRVDAPHVGIGSALPWWYVSPNIASAASFRNGDLNYFLRDVSQNLPCFDQAVTMDDAVKLTPA